MEDLSEITDTRCDLVELLKSKQPVKVCAPMVRYSKLAFRTLVRKYGCDLAYTPMIVSSSFIKSKSCRDVEFITNAKDRPLVVQFAASNAKDFADATELVYPYCDGVCLNCGCPQRWAMAEGYGAKLLQNPERLADFVKCARNRISDPVFAISAKIRLHKDIKKTVALCKSLEQSGLSYISIHGRTTAERYQPVHYDEIKLIKDLISIPVVANGDITSMEDVSQIHQITGADGVMAARGILSNPAMYSGFQQTPFDCIKDWVDISLNLGTSFTCFHNHLIYMLEKVTSKPEKRIFNSLQSTPAVLEYLDKFSRIYV
uniref:tRNA-dihydrouridine synthase n=1 Tax=Phallusia mammillata TaxID=59560 RepID=A0A6F9DBL5_9ASCI|nr:tRNA-dihydrouridine(20a/20b) synthase [NAD(P)+]-like [Phallusia mammillata]